MHELSIAIGIVDGAADAARRHGGGTVTAVHVRIGPLSCVVPDALCSAFELAREQDGLLASAELRVETVPVSAYCPRCAAERAVSFPGLLCPDCGTPTPDVVRGRELEVVALELET